MVLVCESAESRDELMDLVSTTNKKNIIMNTPNEKRVSITIVGLQREYEKEEVPQMLELQNSLIKTIAVSNKIEDHVVVQAIKPLKNNPDRYQVFAKVSPVLRQDLQHYNNIVTQAYQHVRFTIVPMSSDVLTAKTLVIMPRNVQTTLHVAIVARIIKQTNVLMWQGNV